MVLLETPFQAAQDTDGVFHRRFDDIDLLEATRQGTILFEDAVPSQPSLRILFLEYNKLVARLVAWMIGW